MKIAFASDHAGFELKNALIDFVKNELGHEVEDYGATELDPEDDFPVFIQKAALAVQQGSAEKAIVLGGSGEGEAMMANRNNGIRAAVFYGGPLDIVKLSREHNDANVLSLGARFVDLKTAQEAVKIWLSTSPLNEAKYQRRNKQLDSE